MKITEFNSQVLSIVKKNLPKNADARCYANVQYILEKKIFGKSKKSEEIKPQYMNDVYGKFLTELDKIIAKNHFPKESREKTLQAFKTVSEKISAIASQIRKPNGGKNLVEVFQDTLNFSKNLPENKFMIANTKCYQMDSKGELLERLASVQKYKRVIQKEWPIKKTKVEVLNCDTFAAAKLLRDLKYNVLVLNMANRFSAGGGVTEGSKAQEEDLMRKSNYFYALSQKALSTKQNSGPRVGRYLYNHPIPELGCIYTPKIKVLKDQNYQYLSKKNSFFVDGLALAGYDLGKLEKLDKKEKANLLNKKGEVDLNKFKEATKNKIRLALMVAKALGYDALVLGALSCGAFKLKGDNSGLTANVVAQAYKEVLREPEFSQAFSHIIFAVLDSNPNPTSNYTIFNKVLGNLNLNPKAAVHKTKPTKPKEVIPKTKPAKPKVIPKTKSTTKTSHFILGIKALSVMSIAAMGSWYFGFALLSSLGIFAGAGLLCFGAFKWKQNTIAKNRQAIKQNFKLWQQDNQNVYEIGYKAKDWLPAMQSYFQIQSYWRPSAYDIGLEDALNNRPHRFKL